MVLCGWLRRQHMMILREFYMRRFDLLMNRA
jgi:hypothetical protein